MKSSLKKADFIFYAGLMLPYLFVRAWTPLSDLLIVAPAIIVTLFSFLEWQAKG
jgi:hypothetical protein